MSDISRALAAGRIEQNGHKVAVSVPSGIAERGQDGRPFSKHGLMANGLIEEMRYGSDVSIGTEVIKGLVPPIRRNRRQLQRSLRGRAGRDRTRSRGRSGIRNRSSVVRGGHPVVPVVPFQTGSDSNLCRDPTRPSRPFARGSGSRNRPDAGTRQRNDTSAHSACGIDRPSQAPITQTEDCRLRVAPGSQPLPSYGRPPQTCPDVLRYPLCCCPRGARAVPGSAAKGRLK